MKTICFCSQKGGTGKTTSTAALSNALIKQGFRVLCVDMNAQRNLSATFGASTQGLTAADVLEEPETLKDAIQHTEQGDIVAGDKSLANADILRDDAQIKYTALKMALEPVKRQYDFCLVDSPPFIGTLFINAVMAADYMVIVCESDVYSIAGLQDLTENIKDIKKYNKKLKIAGILLTRYTGRASLSRQLLAYYDEPAKALRTTVFETPIRENISIKEAHLMMQSIYKYAPRSNAAKDYWAFCNELLERI